jgi:hypothetical protein
MILIISLLINPLLKWQLPKFALSGTQLTLIFGVVLVACTSTSYINALPHTIAKITSEASNDRYLSKIHNEMDLPDSLYIEPIEYGADTEISNQLLEELEPGTSIPWDVWMAPMSSWGLMIVFFLLILVGLSLILFPQWRDNERLPFPLITVHQSLVEQPTDGGKLPVIFRSGLFWFSFICVIIVFGCTGLAHHTGDNFPKFGLNWSLYNVFGNGMFGNIKYYIKQGGIHFIVIGITYFMPNRISFSLWFGVIAYSTYRMLGYTFFTPFYGDAAMQDHRTGATVAIALIIIWLSRSQWKKVFVSMITACKDDIDKRNRFAGYLFTLGCLGLLSWQLWAGNSFIFSVMAVVTTILSSIIVARIAAEAGVPFFASSFGVTQVMALFPITWLSTKAIYITHLVDTFINGVGSKVSAVVTMMHAIGMNKNNTPKQHIKLTSVFFIVIVVGIIVAGAVHIDMAYHNPASLDGKVTPIQNKSMNTFSKELSNFDRGNWAPHNHNRIGHTVFGFVLAFILQILCLASPLWPFHPIGLLLSDTPFMFAT